MRKTVPKRGRRASTGTERASQEVWVQVDFWTKLTKSNMRMLKEAALIAAGLSKDGMDAKQKRSATARMRKR